MYIRITDSETGIEETHIWLRVLIHTVQQEISAESSTAATTCRTTVAICRVTLALTLTNWRLPGPERPERAPL